MMTFIEIEVKKFTSRTPPLSHGTELIIMNIDNMNSYDPENKKLDVNGDDRYYFLTDESDELLRKFLSPHKLHKRDNNE